MSDSEEQMRRIDLMIRERDAAAELAERGARRVRAAAKLSPESVNYGIATGMSRCGLCKFFEPSSNPMTGRCEIVDVYRTERNDWCERFEPSAPSTAGDHGGAVARSAQEFLNLVTAGRPSSRALVASNWALLGRVRMHRDSMAQRYGRQQPKLFARWCGDGD